MPDIGDRSLADIIENIVGNIQGIIRSEIRLAKTEVQEEAAKAGKAGGILAGGAVLALYALGFLLLTCLYALEIALAPWLAGLIMMILVGVGAAVLISAGLKKMKQVHPRPDQTIQTIKENLEWAKERVR
jgi:uncharacterized membrane protein YqjE